MAADTDHAEYLASLTNKHEERLASALVTLERRIADYVATAPLQDGQLFDLEWAVNARPEIRRLIREEYLVEIDTIIRDYREVHQQAIGMIGTYGDVIDIDSNIVSQLQGLSFQGFADIGNEYLDVIAKQVYESTLTGTTFAASVAAVQQAVGGGMARYAKQQVHDSLMQFDANVNVAVGKASGATRWKYFGRLVEESRSHCREHKGKVYTEEEIYEIWSGSWAGKIEGNPFVVRGGYNCGHHWRPVFD